METNITDPGFTSIRYFRAKRKLSDSEIKQFNRLLYDQPGVVSIDMKPEGASVEFYSHVLSESYIKKLLQERSFPFAGAARENRVKRFLENLADANRKAYGNQQLDCCGLNHAK